MKRGGPDHPKMGRLARALGIRAREAVGMVEMLFHFTDTYAPRGDVGRFEDDEIAIRLDWDGDAAELVAALAATGWLDAHSMHRLVVHDWPDHAPEYTKKKANGTKSKSGEIIKEGWGWAVDDEPESVTETDTSCTQTGESEGFQKVPDDSGLPSPSKPIQAKPDHSLVGDVAGADAPTAEREPDPSKASKKPEPPPSWATDLATLLRDLLAEYEPGAKKPRALVDWAKPIARIEAEPGEISETLGWLFGPNRERECAFVVQSGSSLREKYGRIRAVMRSESNARASPNRAEQQAERSKSVARQLFEESTGRA